jgi:hypothetical protein
MPYQEKQRHPTSRSQLRALILQNTRLARRAWEITTHQGSVLKTLTQEFQLSVALGDLNLLDNKWYVTHSGLLRLARRNRCAGIEVRPMRDFSEPALGRWVFRATVHKSKMSKPFVGYGDADPSNVSTLVHGAEMRIAETRAVNRALRKAYGIGLCSVEELGTLSRGPASSRNHQPLAESHPPSGASNGQPRLRDQLCGLIRQHNLDPTLVKAYAADFCGTPSLKEANRDLVQSFISHLTACAKENRDMLVCRLNSYAQPVSVVKQ